MMGFAADTGGWECPPPVTSFDGVPFNELLRRELRTTVGFAAPSAVQAQCWPVAMTGHDTVVVAQTGSGKVGWG
jgi:ATP-dependent RNA helicase DDX5/DBP2